MEVLSVVRGTADGAGSVGGSLNSLADFFVTYAIALVAVGALAMALIEAAKNLLRLRDRYHMFVLRRWIVGAPRRARKKQKTAPIAPGDELAASTLALSQLLHLTTGTPAEWGSLTSERPWRSARLDITPENALYGLELPRMMAQIHEAAATALDFPQMYPELFEFLIDGASERDRNAWNDWCVMGIVALEGQDPAAAYPELDGGVAAAGNEAREQKYIGEVRARVQQQARRKLDSFQITTEYHWRRANQQAAYIVGFLILWIAVHRDGLSWIDPRALLAALFGGSLAPVAKDLVSALKRFRGG